MGFGVELEPNLGISRKIPDFLLTKSNDQIIVEATTNQYSLTSKVPNFNIRTQIVDELNDLELGDLRLLIYDLRLFVTQKPSINGLKKQLIDHCKEIDLNVHTNHSFVDSENDRFPYEDGNLSFNTSFFVDKKTKTQSRKTVYADSYDIGIDETVKELNKSVKIKKSRYGEFHKPFIICVNFPYMMLDQDEILSIIGPSERHRSGFVGKRPRLSALDNLIDNSISALFISFVTPFNISDPQFWFIKNPNADSPIGSDKFPIDTYENESGGFVFKPAQISISELLSIP
jgi:hypothetical protein